LRRQAVNAALFNDHFQCNVSAFHPLDDDATGTMSASLDLALHLIARCPAEAFATSNLARRLGAFRNRVSHGEVIVLPGQSTLLIRKWRGAWPFPAKRCTTGRSRTQLTGLHRATAERATEELEFPKENN
jgi:hypothetical protein